jgi:membrane-associated protease RseP (regulator of RpoE activity)
MISHLSVATHLTVRVLAATATNFAWGCLHMLIHETGHILAAWMVGSHIKQVGISFAGPYVRRTPARTPLRNIIVALAGPGINLLTCVVFLAFGLPHPWLAMAFGVMNLLPLPNSDFTKSFGYLTGRAKRRGA